jgi:hypothetical protein
VINLGRRMKATTLRDAIGEMDHIRAFENVPVDHSWDSISFDFRLQINIAYFVPVLIITRSIHSAGR